MAPLERYIQIAATLPSKTARDVALRVKACGLDEGKPRKADEGGGGKRKGGSGKARGGAGEGGGGGEEGSGVPAALTHFMESNYAILAQFKTNMAAFKVRRAGAAWCSRQRAPVSQWSTHAWLPGALPARQR
jgi:hypothetical protein